MANFPVFPAGTRVRSYDFMGVDNCYIEGTIEGYGGGPFPSDSHYRIRTERRVWDGKEDPVCDVRERIVYPPMQGMFGKQLVFKLEG